jgi:putative spermidine/putrescine transport system substrate-binding protein
MYGLFKGRLGVRLAATAAIGASVLLASGAFAQEAQDFDGEELIVQTYGGTLAIYFRDTFAAEFNEKYNADVQVQEGLSTDTVAKLRADGGVPHVDTFMVTEPWAAVLQAENLTLPLDAAKMPALGEIEAVARTEGDSYAVFSRTSMVISYNTDLVKPEDLPKHWKDLSDPKYKGQVTLPVPGNAHAVMLMAKLAHLETGSIDNIDAAITDLKTIAPNVLTYWTSFDQAFNLLNSGQNLISVNSMDRTIDQVKKGAPVSTYFPEEGTIFLGNTLGIAKGTEHQALAEAWINFLLEKEQQERIANVLGFVPVRGDVSVDPAVAALLPQGEALKNSLYPSWADIANKQADWIDRYTKEVAGN